MTKTGKITRYRWRILALLFMATTINYMDRTVIGVLASTLQYKIFNWSDMDYANISIIFKVAYAIGMLTMGGVIDRFGTRIGYTLSIAIWSIFGMLHAAIKPAFSVIGFMLARFGLGFGEAGNFPAAVKTVAEWFPKKERALANGIFNAGSNIGAILAPLIIPLFVVASTGKNWQWAFLMTGFLSGLWVILWLISYRKPEEHPKISKEELEYIQSDSVVESNERISWWKLLFVRQTWAFPIVKLTDAVWWFYLFWAGKFLFDMFGLDINAIALPLIAIFLMADVGSISGGWLSSYFIKKGWSVNKSRKLTLLFCALIIMPVMFVTKVKTGFEVTPEKIEKLAAAEIKQEGKISQVPSGLVATVQKFEGLEYKAARDFEDDLAKEYGTYVIDPYLDLISENSATENGTYMVSDKTIDVLASSGMPEDLLLNMRRINSRSPEKKEKPDISAHQSYIRQSIGKMQISQYESSIFRIMRTNRMYWIAVLLIAIAAGGHQAWAANIFTLVSDVLPKKATASVVGIGGMVGAFAGIAGDKILGNLLASSGPSGYFFAFLVAGLLYLVTLGIVHLLIPDMQPLGEDLKPVKTKN